MSAFFDDAFSQFPGASIGPNIVSDFGSGALPVFDASGRMLGNMTSIQGQVPTANNALDTPALPSIGGTAGSAAGKSIQDAASAVGITGGSLPPAATTGSTSAGGVAGNWFTRAVIVILGFIFVAVGLSQFGVVQKFGR